jgi:predicted ATPase
MGSQDHRACAVTLRAVTSCCSGGGKSTLPKALSQCGFATVAEPGRRIVAAERRGAGGALPWVDMGVFVCRPLQPAVRDRRAVMSSDGWVFFDCGLVDAAVALEHAEGIPVRDGLAGTPRYRSMVSLTSPWPEIYRTDAARRHGFEAAVAEQDWRLGAYDTLGYELVILPKCHVCARGDHLLDCLE